jgi:oligopeptide transport system permease protein
MIFAIFFGISSGVYAGLRPNSAHDYIPMSISMIGICIPSFLMGPIMVLFFGIYLGWLPISGWDNTPGDKILPTVTLGLGYAAFVSRLSRGGILEIMTRDYIRTARAKGLPSGIVVIKHALRGGLIPVVAFLGPAFAGLLSGSFIVETIFQIPGLGRFYIQAAFNRDYTMILGTTIFFATLIIIFNLLSDILVVWLNPKLRDKYRLNK